MIERRESEMIAQDLRNQAKQRQAATSRQPTPKSAQRRAAVKTNYNK